MLSLVKVSDVNRQPLEYDGFYTSGAVVVPTEVFTSSGREGREVEASHLE